MTAYPISQAAVITTEPISDGIRAMIVEENPIMDFITWAPVAQGNAQRRWFEESALPTTAYRNIGSDYTPSFGRLIPKSDPVSILGGEFEIDIAMPRLYGNDVPDFVMRQLFMLARSSMIQFEETWFNGYVGVDPASFDGLRPRATERNMVYSIATGGGAAGELTLAILDEVFMAVVGGKVVHLNQWLYRKVNALMRAANQARETVDGTFGRQYETYAGVPMVIQERRDNMSTFLGFDEDPGDGGDDAASIFVVHYGGPDEDQSCMGIVGAGGAWDAYELRESFDSPKDKWRLEVYPGMSNQGNRAIGQISGVGQI